MKAPNKVSLGKDFRGILDYVLRVSRDPALPAGRVIGGNSPTRNAAQLVKIFNTIKRVRPDVDKPVWHNSLRLTASEKISDAMWRRIVGVYMQRMGFSDENLYCVVAHDDENAIHIVASRVGLDRSLRIFKNEGQTSSEIIRDLEKEFALTVTEAPAHEQQNGSGGRQRLLRRWKARLTKAEFYLERRTSRTSAKSKIQELIDQCEGRVRSIADLVEELKGEGVSSLLNISADGQFCGIGFKLGSAAFKGSALGRGYSSKGLSQRGFAYDFHRDSERLSKFSTDCRWQPNIESRTDAVQIRAVVGVVGALGHCAGAPTAPEELRRSLPAGTSCLDSAQQQVGSTGTPVHSGSQALSNITIELQSARSATIASSQSDGGQHSGGIFASTNSPKSESTQMIPSAMTTDELANEGDGEPDDLADRAWVDRIVWWWEEYGGLSSESECVQQCAHALLSEGFCLTFEAFEKYSGGEPFVANVLHYILQSQDSDSERDGYDCDLSRG